MWYYIISIISTWAFSIRYIGSVRWVFLASENKINFFIYKIGVDAYPIAYGLMGLGGGGFQLACINLSNLFPTRYCLLLLFYTDR